MDKHRPLWQQLHHAAMQFMQKCAQSGQPPKPWKDDPLVMAIYLAFLHNPKTLNFSTPEKRLRLYIASLGIQAFEVTAKIYVDDTQYCLNFVRFALENKTYLDEALQPERINKHYEKVAFLRSTQGEAVKDLLDGVYQVHPSTGGGAAAAAAAPTVGRRQSAAGSSQAVRAAAARTSASDTVSATASNSTAAATPAPAAASPATVQRKASTTASTGAAKKPVAVSPSMFRVSPPKAKPADSETVTATVGSPSNSEGLPADSSLSSSLLQSSVDLLDHASASASSYPDNSSNNNNNNNDDEMPGSGAVTPPQQGDASDALRSSTGLTVESASEAVAVLRLKPHKKVKKHREGDAAAPTEGKAKKGTKARKLKAQLTVERVGDAPPAPAPEDGDAAGAGAALSASVTEETHGAAVAPQPEQNQPASDVHVESVAAQPEAQQQQDETHKHAKHHHTEAETPQQTSEQSAAAGSNVPAAESKPTVATAEAASATVAASSEPQQQQPSPAAPAATPAVADVSAAPAATETQGPQMAESVDRFPSCTKTTATIAGPFAPEASDLSSSSSSAPAPTPATAAEENPTLASPNTSFQVVEKPQCQGRPVVEDVVKEVKLRLPLVPHFGSSFYILPNEKEVSQLPKNPPRGWQWVDEWAPDSEEWQYEYLTGGVSDSGGLFKFKKTRLCRRHRVQMEDVVPLPSPGGPEHPTILEDISQSIGGFIGNVFHPVDTFSKLFQRSQAGNTASSTSTAAATQQNNNHDGDEEDDEDEEEDDVYKTSEEDGFVVVDELSENAEFLSLLVNPAPKITPTDQDGRCAECQKWFVVTDPTNPMEHVRRCEFTGRLFCTRKFPRHEMHPTVLPIRVLKNADFREYPVCVHAYDMLQRNASIAWVNPDLVENEALRKDMLAVIELQTTVSNHFSSISSKEQRSQVLTQLAPLFKQHLDFLEKPAAFTLSQLEEIHKDRKSVEDRLRTAEAIVMEHCH
eukprot:m.27892 g.27892  ORF g.27892 m.27892 type:complete len:977 (+) comp10170_c0_seq1:358-3288(+)